MKSRFNLQQYILTCLKSKPNQKLTARQLAEWIFQTYRQECEEKRQRSKATVIPLDTDEALITQLVSEVGSRSALEKLGIKTTEERPRKYYFTTQTDEEEVQQAESVNTVTKTKKDYSLSEHDLYPLLTQYLQNEFGIYSKRIDEKRSKNNNGSKGNQWLHPDLVGLQDLSQDWHSEIKQCVKAYSDKQTKLWSFEVKILLNRSNVRESFFQTVSNSAWANFSYLVASRIDGKDTLKELRLLSALHGVGIIQLDVEDPNESQIIIPARESSDVDWDATNRLVEENKDFQEYIELIREFYQTGKIRKENWRIQ
ncbi:MAG: HrgA protein [Candidatus Melainabacteria bacterium]|nr:HrgA protein [Candidatus Melainabacteria bacterium]